MLGDLRDEPRSPVGDVVVLSEAHLGDPTLAVRTARDLCCPPAARWAVYS